MARTQKPRRKTNSAPNKPSGRSPMGVCIPSLNYKQINSFYIPLSTVYSKETIYITLSRLKEKAILVS